MYSTYMALDLSWIKLNVRGKVRPSLVALIEPQFVRGITVD